MGKLVLPPFYRLLTKKEKLGGLRWVCSIFENALNILGSSGLWQPE